MSERVHLTRITLNLTPEAAAVLERAPVGAKTDLVNRSIVVWDVVRQLLVDGKLTVVKGNGTHAEVYIL